MDHQGILDLNRSQLFVMTILLSLIILLGVKPMIFFGPALENLRKTLITISYF